MGWIYTCLRIRAEALLGYTPQPAMVPFKNHASDCSFFFNYRRVIPVITNATVSYRCAGGVTRSMEIARFMDLKQPSDHFAHVVRAYIRWIEIGKMQPADLVRLHGLLAALQTAIVALPPVAATDESDEATESDLRLRTAACGAMVDRLSSVLPVREYRFVFNVLEEPDVVSGDLSSDLAEICQDIQDGLEHYEAGNAAAAIWEWRFGYFTHWGRHLINAQTAIWQHLSYEGGAFLAAG